MNEELLEITKQAISLLTSMGGAVYLSKYCDELESLLQIEQPYSAYRTEGWKKANGEARDLIHKLEKLLDITIKERGWTGHYCLGHDCIYSRNTLVNNDNTRVIVSSVGNLVTRNSRGEIESILNEISDDRFYETKVFYAIDEDGYVECDLTKEIILNTKQSLSKSELGFDRDNQADAMHDECVAEVVRKLESGELK